MIAVVAGRDGRGTRWRLVGRTGRGADVLAQAVTGRHGEAETAGGHGEAGFAASRGEAGTAGSRGQAGTAGNGQAATANRHSQAATTNSRSQAGTDGSRGQAGIGNSRGQAGTAGNRSRAGTTGRRGDAGISGGRAEAGSRGQAGSGAAPGAAYGWQEAVARLRDGAGDLRITVTGDGHFQWILAGPDGTPIAESPAVYRDALACREGFATAQRAARAALGGTHFPAAGVGRTAARGD
jgi:hypothetical protein